MTVIMSIMSLDYESMYKMFAMISMISMSAFRSSCNFVYVGKTNAALFRGRLRLCSPPRSAAAYTASEQKQCYSHDQRSAVQLRDILWKYEYQHCGNHTHTINFSSYTQSQMHPRNGQDSNTPSISFYCIYQDQSPYQKYSFD